MLNQLPALFVKFFLVLVNGLGDRLTRWQTLLIVEEVIKSHTFFGCVAHAFKIVVLERNLSNVCVYLDKVKFQRN